MSEENQKPKKLSLSGAGKLTLGGNLDQSALRGNAVGAARGKTVQVEVQAQAHIAQSSSGTVSRGAGNTGAGTGI